MHPAKDGFAALPFFDDFDLSSIDILVISQYVDLIILLLFYILPVFLLCWWLGYCTKSEATRRPVKVTEELQHLPTSHNVCFPTLFLKHVLSEIQYNF